MVKIYKYKIQLQERRVYLRSVLKPSMKDGYSLLLDMNTDCYVKNLQK